MSLELPKNKIIQGDCLEVMKDFPDNSVDLVLTDPPYNIDGNFDMKNLESKGKDYSTNKGEWDSIDSLDKFNGGFLNECFRILECQGSILVFASQHNIFSVGKIMKEIGFEIYNIIKWIKPDAMPNMSKSRLKQDTEYIILGIKGEDYTFNYNESLQIEDKFSRKGKQLSDTWISGKTKGGKRDKHPTQKPTWIIERLLEIYSLEGDLVLDPFLGSGTTAVACKKLGRDFIGIEKEEKYVKIARERS